MAGVWSIDDDDLYDSVPYLRSTCQSEQDPDLIIHPRGFGSNKMNDHSIPIEGRCW